MRIAFFVSWTASAIVDYLSTASSVAWSLSLMRQVVTQSDCSDYRRYFRAHVFPISSSFDLGHLRVLTAASAGRSYLSAFLLR